MKISDLNEDEIRIGLRLKGLKSGKPGTVVGMANSACDDYWYIRWDGEEEESSGFFYNDCDCDIITGEDGKPLYVTVSPWYIEIRIPDGRINEIMTGFDTREAAQAAAEKMQIRTGWTFHLIEANHG